MSNPNGWGDGSVNNNIGWGQGANNSTGWGKSHLSSWSGATDIDGGNLPSNSVAPAITGTAQEGQTLTCSTGTWSGSPTYTYQWKRNGNNIGSATNSTYLLVTADVGQSILCTVTATNFVGSASANSNTVTPTSSVDADAQAFITAASITNPTQQSAINQLVVDLKGYNIWTKMKALYPFVGGTATTHKFNLKDPRDLDAAFRLQFIGGWTHSNAGALQNAFCYADTKFTPSGNLTATSAHHSAYLRVNRTIGQQSAYGSYTGTTADMQLYPYTFNIGWINDLFDNSQSRISVNTGNSTGFILGSRASSSSHKLFRNGSQIAATTNNTNGTPPNIPYFIGAVNLNSVVSFYDVQQFAFYSIGDGLTDTEAANFYTAVQAFNTTLGRQV